MSMIVGVRLAESLEYRIEWNWLCQCFGKIRTVAVEMLLGTHPTHYMRLSLLIPSERAELTEHLFITVSKYLGPAKKRNNYYSGSENNELNQRRSYCALQFNQCNEDHKDYREN